MAVTELNRVRRLRETARSWGISFEPIDSWSDARQFIRRFSPRWIFRGQANAAWTLKTSLERVTNGELMPKAEDFVFAQFIRGAFNHLSASFMPVMKLEWLALMQHHGAPTRLLDWTGSPYVAAYFALVDASEQQGNCSVWAIDAQWCLSRSVDLVRSTFAAHRNFHDAQIYIDEVFKSIMMTNLVNVIYPFNPTRMHQRLFAQQGRFLCPSNILIPFMESLRQFGGNGLKGHVVQIVLPNSVRQEALIDLDLMNINHATLFPGIDGFARSIGVDISKGPADEYLVRTERQNRADGFPYVP